MAVWYCCQAVLAERIWPARLRVEKHSKKA